MFLVRRRSVRRIALAVVFLSVALVVAPANAAHVAKNGEICKEVGATAATKGVTFTCQMFGKSLKWVYQPSPPQTAGVKNFAVNGISGLWPSAAKKANNRAGSTEWSNYLAIELTEVRGGEFVSIPWTGDWSDCDDQNVARNELVKKIEDAYSANNEIKINLVTHSHGTIIAYNALRLLDIKNLKLKEMGKDTIRINNFLSMGTIIGLLDPPIEDNVCLFSGESALDLFATPASVTNWVNVYSDQDQVFSKPVNITGVADIKWSLAPLDSHKKYFKMKDETRVTRVSFI